MIDIIDLYVIGNSDTIMFGENTCSSLVFCPFMHLK